MFLNLLLWSTSLLLRPTFRKLAYSYENWAYHRNLLREVMTLEKRQLVETVRQADGDRLCRLTEQGRIHALGGRDPQMQWSRPWDGHWRLVLFDVPVARNSQRERLRRYLRDRGYGCLQGSVWVTPDPLRGEREILASTKVDVGALLLLDARPCAGETDAEIVDGAWDCRRINHCYERHLNILRARPTGTLHGERAAKALQRWAASEREAWLAAVTRDPLLPHCLLPRGYLGREAWRRRVEVLRQAGDYLRSFSA
jgi:phenylacetic acid degradation operon negative regulatory protein